MEHRVNEALKYVISLACNVCQGDVPAAILILLIDLGFPSQAEGFWFLRQAILIRYRDPELRMSEITEQIAAASKTGQNANAIEQSIHSVIETTWKSRDREKWDYFFSSEKIGKRTKPTNKEFISEMGCIMELWFSSCKGAMSCGTK